VEKVALSQKGLKRLGTREGEWEEEMKKLVKRNEWMQMKRETLCWKKKKD